MAFFDIQASIRARLESASAPLDGPGPSAASVSTLAVRAQPSPESSPRVTVEKDKDEDSETPRPKVKAVPKPTMGKGNGRGRGKGRGRGAKQSCEAKPGKSSDEAEPKEAKEKDNAEPKEAMVSIQTEPGDEAEADAGGDEDGANAAGGDSFEDGADAARALADASETPDKGPSKKPAAKTPSQRKALKRPAAAHPAPGEPPAPKSNKQRKGETTRETRHLKSGWKAGRAQLLLTLFFALNKLISGSVIINYCMPMEGRQAITQSSSGRFLFSGKCQIPAGHQVCLQPPQQLLHLHFSWWPDLHFQTQSCGAGLCGRRWSHVKLLWEWV